MRILRLTIVTVFLFCQHGNIAAQQATAKTLLWRISGKGLQNPSYLYGTMHLFDRRLFYFGDSVYNSIEKTEGFAMELNPKISWIRFSVTTVLLIQHHYLKK